MLASGNSYTIKCSSVRVLERLRSGALKLTIAQALKCFTTGTLKRWSLETLEHLSAQDFHVLHHQWLRANMCHMNVILCFL